MYQIVVYCDVGATTTVDFVGVARVAGKERRQRVVDGRMLPRHFVFAGAPGNEVHGEVLRYNGPAVSPFLVQEKAWLSERVMLEVEIMVRFKSSLKARCTVLYSKTPPRTASQRCYDMLQRSMHGIRSMRNDTIKNEFIKAKPFIPIGPPEQPTDVYIFATEVIVLSFLRLL
ncbi:hypothetical protein PHMEG_00010343 [Phytophthora megakarya]|uniref:Uncharacterized protein n=1 Tax=Phytophthora megakarya TaxID=4795 RepID=A0A225WEH4_9STRA|nr:hypothetical protein PHMEG_00010343 [Phytophthora megakarya]